MGSTTSLYFIATLRPLTSEIKIQEREIECAKVCMCVCVMFLYDVILSGCPWMSSWHCPIGRVCGRSSCRLQPNPSHTPMVLRYLISLSLLSHFLFLKSTFTDAISLSRVYQQEGLHLPPLPSFIFHPSTFSITFSLSLSLSFLLLEVIKAKIDKRSKIDILQLSISSFQ